MKSERRGLMIVVAVLLLSAVLGGVYGPNVRATTASADDYQSAVRDFTRMRARRPAFSMASSEGTTSNSYDEKGWRAAFYTTGMEHSPTSATGTGWERTPWHATQRAAREALEAIRPKRMS